MEKDTEVLDSSKQSAPQEAAAALPVPSDAHLEKQILNTTYNKYDVILLARRWTYELKAKEGETRSTQELISVAVDDILSQRVSAKAVKDLPKLARRSRGSGPSLDNVGRAEKVEEEASPKKEAASKSKKSKEKDADED